MKTSHGRRCCDGQQTGLLFFLRNDPGCSTVGAGKVIVDVTATKQARYELAAQQSVVRRNGAKSICIHEIDEAGAPVLRVPADEPVPHRKIKHWVADCDKAKELPIVFIPNKITQTSAEAVGHRD